MLNSSRIRLQYVIRHVPTRSRNFVQIWVINFVYLNDLVNDDLIEFLDALKTAG